MLLDRLLHSMEYCLLCGNTAVEITGICDHSAELKPGDLFVCIKGSRTDGHRYLKDAYGSGAAGIVVEDISDELNSLMKRYPDTAVIQVRNTMKALALIASAFYGDPARRMTVIGITGTKGKTTTACMLNAILRRAGIASGTIGTLGVWYDELLEEPVTTTPDAITLHRLLAEMEKRGCTHVVLEVSSQSLIRMRVYGIPFSMAIYTNLYPDHIGTGEHSSYEEYRYWKSTLFANAKVSVINKLADSWEMMTGMSAGKVIYYGLDDHGNCSQETDFVKTVRSVTGASANAQLVRMDLSLPGRYNRENALAAITAAMVLKVPDEAFIALETVQVPGRTEILEGDGYRVVIDYAHNESSMENLLITLRELNPRRLICVYGSGGNRSLMRRHGMGRVGGKLADLSVLTEDNSRTEPLDQILEGLIAGVSSSGGDYLVIPDRKKAIHQVIRQAKEGDLIAIIGKGHENYQEIGTERFPFSDREEARLAMGGFEN